MSKNRTKWGISLTTFRARRDSWWLEGIFVTYESQSRTVYANRRELVVIPVVFKIRNSIMSTNRTEWGMSLTAFPTRRNTRWLEGIFVTYKIIHLPCCRTYHYMRNEENQIEHLPLYPSRPSTNQYIYWQLLMKRKWKGLMLKLFFSMLEILFFLLHDSSIRLEDCYPRSI